MNEYAICNGNDAEVGLLQDCYAGRYLHCDCDVDLDGEGGAFCVVVLCGRAEGRKIEKDLLRIFRNSQETQGLRLSGKKNSRKHRKRSRMETLDLHLVRPQLSDNLY